MRALKIFFHNVQSVTPLIHVWRIVPDNNTKFYTETIVKIIHA